MSLKKKGSKRTAKKSVSKTKPEPKAKPQHAHAGAPTKYRPEYCQAILKHASKLGGTLASFAIKIGVHTDTLQEWASKHPEFSVAKRRAKQIQEQLMTEVGLRGIQYSRNFSAAGWIFMMKARYGWREEGPADQDENEMDFDYE